MTFGTNVEVTHEWVHTVMNYIGSNDCEGHQIYHDSIIAHRSTYTFFRDIRNRSGNKNLVLGRYYNNVNDQYASFQVDELYFFNRMLTEAEIRMLSQNTS